MLDGVRRHATPIAVFLALAFATFVFLTQSVRSSVPDHGDAWSDMFPVVEPRSFHLTFIKGKAKRLDEVQNRTRGETCTPGISGVPVNFGMHEYDVGFHCFWCQCTNAPQTVRGKQVRASGVRPTK